MKEGSNRPIGFSFTGPGERRLTKEQHSGEPSLILHWGLRNTVLTDENVEPIIVHLDAILSPSTLSLTEILRQQPVPKGDIDWKSLTAALENLMKGERKRNSK
jgi:hypothetical protein